MYGNLRYVRHFVSKLFTVDYLKCVLLKLLSWDQSYGQKHSDEPFWLKILTVTIRAHDGRAEYCLNWNIYEFGVNCEF